MVVSLRTAAAALALAAAACIATPALAQQATNDPAKLEQAKKHMQAGAAFYNDPSGHKCEEALKEFGQAYELSGSLNALRGMAICNLELERDGEAIPQYQAYLKGKGDKIEPADKQQMDSDLATLKAAAAKVAISVDRGAVKIVDVRTPSRGYPVTNEYQVGAAGKTLLIHPGSHLLTATIEGGTELKWQVEISNGGSYDHAFEFDKAPPPASAGTGGPTPDQTPQRRPVPVYVWIGAGVSVVLTGVTVAMMLRAKSAKDAYDTANHHETKPQLDKLSNDLKSDNLVADLFLGGSVAVIAATTVLFITRPAVSGPPKTGWTFTPVAGPTGGGAFVSATF
jgi:hypothetical protein